LLLSLAYLHPMLKIMTLGNSVTLKPKRLDVRVILREGNPVLHEVTTENLNKGFGV
jgi:hypothetical protein